MSIRPDSSWRGCAAYFPQPTNESGAQALTEQVYDFNCRRANPPLADIEYRPSSNTREEDIVRHVFRWDDAPYEVIFQNGFIARREQGTPEDVYFNLEHYVNHGGRPLDSRRETTHAFISTTLNSSWHPPVDPGPAREVYRYEIYAPGGILVTETLGDRYQYPSQDEVCFVAGIAPQYIRSAQLFSLTTPPDSRYTRRQRVNDDLIFNAIFNPQSHPQQELLNIRYPVDYYKDENGKSVNLNIRYYTPDGHLSSREKREAAEYNSDDTTIQWYADKVVNSQSYTIDSAFRSSGKNEAYIFMGNEYVLLNYAPNSTDDYVVNGPLLICGGFPSLAGTPFAEYGIDCAFRCRGQDYDEDDEDETWDNEKDEAFIFSMNLCARINYAPGSTNDKIIRGPMTIAAMFPFFKGTVFEKGIDAAFESSYKHEAYLFKDNRYALINYGEDSCQLTAIRLITVGFPSLTGTEFASGIEAAFASHIEDRAYLFKGDFYAQIDFAPRTTDDYIIGGAAKEILPNWPSLASILPRGNRGLDAHFHTKPEEERDHTKPEEERDHDEL